MYLQFVPASKSAARLTLFSYPLRMEAQDLSPGAPVEKITRQFVSEDAFEALGVRPAAGRLVMPAHTAVVVLSYDYWKKCFQADPAIVGRNLRIDLQTYEIAGVARKGFFEWNPAA